MFLIRAPRGKDVAKQLLGKVRGILVTDRWCACSWWPLKNRQLCLAPIIRHFTYASEIRCYVRDLLERGQTCSHKFTATTCAELLKVEPGMWTFVRVEGVEPTNNDGERAIRPAVIWRKISFGTHSSWGSRFVERMLSVVYTLKQQERNALAFLTEAVAAHMAGEPVTVSLLSQTA